MEGFFFFWGLSPLELMLILLLLLAIPLSPSTTSAPFSESFVTAAPTLSVSVSEIARFNADDVVLVVVVVVAIGVDRVLLETTILANGDVVSDLEEVTAVAVTLGEVDEMRIGVILVFLAFFAAGATNTATAVS